MIAGCRCQARRSRIFEINIRERVVIAEVLTIYRHAIYVLAVRELISVESDPAVFRAGRDLDLPELKTCHRFQEILIGIIERNIDNS